MAMFAGMFRPQPADPELSRRAAQLKSQVASADFSLARNLGQQANATTCQAIWSSIVSQSQLLLKRDEIEFYLTFSGSAMFGQPKARRIRRVRAVVRHGKQDSRPALP
jgi:hypothetical protein